MFPSDAIDRPEPAWVNPQVCSLAPHCPHTTEPRSDYVTSGTKAVQSFLRKASPVSREVRSEKFNQPKVVSLLIQ